MSIAYIVSIAMNMTFLIFLAFHFLKRTNTFKHPSPFTVRVFATARTSTMELCTLRRNLLYSYVVGEQIF